MLPDLPKHLQARILPFSPRTKIPPPFGHACRDLFCFESWTNMNTGAYGACPKAVMDAFFRATLIELGCDSCQWNAIAEAAPDRFFKRGFQEPLNAVRRRLAKDYLRCDENDVVLVTNASTGIDCIIRSFQYKPKDVILAFNTAYMSCEKMLHWVLDNYEEVELQVVQLNYPMSDDAVLKAAENAILNIRKEGKAPRLFLLDGISSWPGVIVPWERLCALLREHQVMSLVDGAHTLGQVPLDLAEARPDFFVANLHKWLYAHRSVAVLYVDRELQRHVQGMPTNQAYLKKGQPWKDVQGYSTDSAFVTAFEWQGTVDLSNYLACSMGMDMRKWLGGEEAINAYCHQLAKEGGRKVAEILGTETMEVSDGSTELVGSMINVRIPTASGSLKDNWPFEISRRFLEGDYNTNVPVFSHAGALWTRISAQIFLELSDFENLGRSLKKICDELARS